MNLSNWNRVDFNPEPNLAGGDSYRKRLFRSMSIDKFKAIAIDVESQTEFDNTEGDYVLYAEEKIEVFKAK